MISSEEKNKPKTAAELKAKLAAKQIKEKNEYGTT